MIKNIFKHIHFLMKSTHIRFEGPSPLNALSHLAIGLIVPSISITPDKTGHNTILKGKLGKNDRALALSMKAVQIYCDYNCESYQSRGAAPEKIYSE